MTATTTSYSISNASPFMTYYGQDEHQQQQYQQQQQQLVPHYGQQQYYTNYQIPSCSPAPAYVNYASSTVAASNPPGLTDSASYSSSSTTSLHSNKLTDDANNDDVLGIFSNPTTLSNSTSVAVAQEQQQIQQPVETQQDDAFVSSCSPEIIAQQERLWNEIHQRNSIKKLNNNDNATTAMTVYDPTENNKLVPVPQSENPTGSDAVHPKKYQMKQERKVKTATGAVTGMVVGGVLFGPAWPLGVVVGGAAGGYATKQISKAGERRAQRKWEQRNFQKFAVTESSVARSHDVAFA